MWKTANRIEWRTVPSTWRPAAPAPRKLTVRIDGGRLLAWVFARVAVVAWLAILAGLVFALLAYGGA
jgi:hypothetical protein